MPSNNENSIAPEPFADLTSATILTTLAVSELAYDTYQNGNLDIKGSIDNRKAPEPATVCESVRDKVHRPAQVRGHRLWQGLSFDSADPLPLATPHRQAGLPVNAIHTLSIDRPALAP